MNPNPLAYEFIQEKSPLTWAEAQWGCQQEFINWFVLKDMAMERLEQGSELADEIELAGLLENEGDRAQELAQKLAASEPSQPQAGIEKKWLFLVLADLFLRRHEVADALAEVESIYADFGYPEEIESFVRYMPAAAGYDPLQHTHAQNQQRLFLNWSNYISKNRGGGG